MIKFKSSVAQDIQTLSLSQRKELIEKLEIKLKDNSFNFALAGEMKGLFVCRLDQDWRVIYKKNSEGILVLQIAKKSELY